MSPPPCLYDTVIQSYVQLKSGFNWGGRPFHGPVPTPLKVNGATLGRSCPPGVQLYPILRVWSYRACQPLQVWWFISLYEILALRATTAKVCPMHCQWTFWAIICPWGEHRTPDPLIKVIAHDSRLGRTFWHLIHGSVTKTVGGVARRNKSGRRIIISMTDNNNVLCH